MRRSVWMCIALSLIVASAASACGSSSPTAKGGTSTTARSAAPTGTPIKLGMITAVTGPLSAERAHDVATVQALVKSTNASGGVNGHPVSLIVKDDQSSPSGALSAAQVLQTDGVVGIDFDDATVEGGPAQYLHGQAIPVTGLGDSPSWLNDNNMFGIYGYSGPGTANTTTTGVIEKHLGVARVIGVSYGSIPPSYDGMQGALQGVQQVGLSVAANIGIPLSGENFTTAALQIKDSGAQGVFTLIASNANVSLATALVQEGLHLPGVLFATGYEQATLQASSISSLNGTYWEVSTAPVDVGSPGIMAYQSILNRYAPGVFPGSQETFAYAGAYLLISGLKADGGSTSRSTLLRAISGLTDFTAGGIIANPVNYSKPKNTQLSTLCDYVVQIKGNNFVSIQKTPFCGKAIGS